MVSVEHYEHEHPYNRSYAASQHDLTNRGVATKLWAQIVGVLVCCTQEICVDACMCAPAGVLTSDPRIIPGTRPVNELTFEEATELAYFGAQVLHPQAMQPAIKAEKMGVRVKNSYNRSAARENKGRSACHLWSTLSRTYTSYKKCVRS